MADGLLSDAAIEYAIAGHATRFEAESFDDQMREAGLDPQKMVELMYALWEARSGGSEMAAPYLLYMGGVADGLLIAAKAYAAQLAMDAKLN